MRSGRPRPAPAARSAFAGFRFPPTSSSWGPLLPALWVVYRDVEELLAERGVKVDQVTVYRWVLRFTRLLAEAARPAGMPLAIAGRSTRDLREGRKLNKRTHKSAI
jgi:IS6 family transposase